MKTNPISYAGIIILVLLCNILQAQNFGPYASAVYLSSCSQDNFYNTSGTGANEIGPTGNNFDNVNLGTYTQGTNPSTLVLRGAQVKTFRNPGATNVCSARMFYRVYLASGAGGAFTAMNLATREDCPGGPTTFPSGGPCNAGDIKWTQFNANGNVPAPVNLTTFAPGNYVLEVYYEVSGSNSSSSACNEIVTLNNGGANYKAFFSIQSPTLNSNNPSSCFGSQGSITIGGLTANTSYEVNYTDDGAPVGPLTLITNGSGQLIITGLNAGFYANFTLEINGCITPLFTGQLLSDPIFVPTFPTIPPFCAGTTAPVLPASSTNGIAGTWSPATVSNTATGTYTFTPTGGQCAIAISRTITVIPRTTPAFPFGTSLIICGSGTVPVLPNNSTNGISGNWNPAVVDNNNSGTYTFTPNPGQCANPATFTVTVNPNITPTFSIGTNTSICSGSTAPTLPTTSSNGISGSWSPSTVDNLNSGTYTFTPAAGQCAVPTSVTVTVNPNVIPTFSFGSSLNLCSGATAPTLPGTSDNGVTGTWSPSTVNNTSSGTYTFTPTAGLCAVPASLSVTVTPNITPSFSWGGGFTICSGAGGLPTLSSPSLNGITGTWNVPSIDNLNSGSYTFTPDPGQCALPFTFAVTVTPNVTPAFAFGTNSSICSGATAPSLPNNSSNGITGTWSPSTVDNTNSGTYTFTPNPGQCAVPTSLTVTVNPIITPTFAFGNLLAICAGAGVPALPAASSNGVNGTWSPATVSNQNSAIYTFTPTGGQCAVPITFTVTVSANIVPTFSFGTTLTICANGTVPALPNNSQNGITGTWSPSIADNLNSGTYTFTPDAGQCALNATFTVTVIQNVTPAFSFGTSMTICAGTTAPVLPTTSSNGISGTWSPATVSNQNSATYTFTPNPGQCVIPPTVTFDVTITPNVTPAFTFGNVLSICAGGTVPVLPNTSVNGVTGTWNPAVVNNQQSGVYVFTATAGICALPFTYTVSVSPILSPQFSMGTFQSVCVGSVPPVLLPTSNNGVTGTWSPSVVDPLLTGTYTFTPSAGQCATPTAFIYEISTVPSTNIRNDTTVTDGAVVPAFNFTSTPGAVVRWTNDNATIGLVKTGTGTVPSFTAINENSFPVSGTVTVTPMNNGCAGITQSYKITVLPLNKDLYVPNVFSPNGDGKNDIFYVYGNYISKLEVQIFNQWGQHITTLTNKSQGWDGKFKGSPQPVGVYVYVLKAEMFDKRIINLKGSITLVR